MINSWSNHVKTCFGVVFSLCNFLSDWNLSEHHFFINSSNLMGSEWVLMHYFYNFTIFTHVIHSKKFQELKNDVFVNVFVTHDWWWTFWHSFIYLMISMFSMKIVILRVDQIMWWCDSKNMFLMSNFIETLWKLIFQWFSSVFIKIWSKLHQKTI